MRTLPIAALIALSAMAVIVQGQSRSMQLSPSELREWHRQRAQVQHEEMQREREEARKSCVLPDGSRHPLTTVVTYEAQTYRCVEVFAPTPAGLVPPGENQTLTVRMAGWVRM
jgi:hypothetical protein